MATQRPSRRVATERKPVLSPTRISTYLACAVMYRYIYVDRLGRYYSRARPGYSFGGTLHRVMQSFHDQGAAQTPEQLQELLTQSWISAGYESPAQEEEHRSAGARILQDYHAAQQSRVESGVETVATEKTITWDMGRFKLSGRVDRIDRYTDGRLEVIDYKSGRQEVTSEDVEASLAMSIYQLILKRLHPETPVFATIYCLRSGVSASAEFTKEALEAFERDIRELGAEILDRDFRLVRPTPIDICPECDFLPRCSHYWRERERRARIDEPHSDDGL